MSGRTYTERQVVEMQRDAYVTGARDRQALTDVDVSDDPFVYSIGCGKAPASFAAAKLYAGPKVTRQREVADPENVKSMQWRCIDGVLEFRGRSYSTIPFERFNPWNPWQVLHETTGLRATRDRALLWADLLANPTEEVDA